MTDAELIQLAAAAGFGGNQRNTLLVKLRRFASLTEAPLLWMMERVDPSSVGLQVETDLRDPAYLDEYKKALQKARNT